jgi:serine/threonine protein kinase
MVLLFLLPIASTWEVENGKHTPDSCLATYFVVHFSMTFAQFRDDFWGQGWQFCFVSLVFNLLLLQLVRMNKKDRPAKADQSYFHIMDLLRESGLSHGYCILNSKGTILMCDSNLASLLGAVVGKTFSSIRADGATDSDEEDDGPMEGQRANIPILACDGRRIKVDTCTVRCMLPSEYKDFSNTLDLGQTGANLETVAYIRAIRHRESMDRAGTKEVAPKGLDGLWDQDKTKLTWKALQVKSLSEVPGTDILDLNKKLPASNPRTGAIADDNCSHLSSTVTPFGQDLSDRRMELLRRQTPWSLDDFATPVIVEMELPLSREPSLVSGHDDASSVLSGSLVQARVRLPKGERRKDGSQVSASKRACSDDNSRVSGLLEEVDCESDSENSEEVPTEVINLGAGSSEGMSRVRIGFRSQVLGQQRAELESARKELHVKGEVQADQKELLRTFGKIVTRDFKDMREGKDTDEILNVLAVIVEEDEAKRAELVQLCSELRIACQAFADIDAGKSAVNQLRMPRHSRVDPSHFSSGHSLVKERMYSSMASSEGSPSDGVARDQLSAYFTSTGDSTTGDLSHDSIGANCGSLRKPQWSQRLQRLWAEDGANVGKDEGSCSPRPELLGDPRRPPAPLVILGASMLQQIPANWCALKLLVTLVYKPGDLEDICEYLHVADKAEVRDRLRVWGITEMLEYPVPSTSLRCLSQEALRRAYGDDFLLAQQLGRGATCTVYSAKRLRDGEVFALKEINISRMLRRRCGEQDVDKVRGEMEILRTLEWPTMLYAFDAWWADGRKLVYMLMPSLTGGDLASKVEAEIKRKSRQDSMESAATWYVQTLHGLTYLHWCGVLHRDIKPENLLLDANGRNLRIADLGTAALLPGPGPHPSPRSCLRKAAVTTPQTTAPEIYTQNVAYPSSDLWSVGATFYEVLVLEPMLPPNQPLERYEDLVQTINDAKVREIKDKVQDVILSDLRTVPVVLAGELADLLCQDPLQRPSGASLIRQPHNLSRLRAVLADGHPGHFEDLQQVLEESEIAASTPVGISSSDSEAETGNSTESR